MANGITLRPGQKLPDNAQWTNRFQIKSGSSNRLYTIAQNKSGRWWGCSCPGWIFHKHCKHQQTLGIPGNYRPMEISLHEGTPTVTQIAIEQPKHNHTESKPVCKVIGTDGNVFAIIGKVTGCLKKAGLKDKADEFAKKAFSSGSYGDVLCLMSDYVEVA